MENYKARILYVEDDVNLSFVTRDNLEQNGYQVTYCENGQLAIEAFAVGKFDLCILDIMLPELDGFTVSRYIRERDNDIPIIFLTAKSMKEDKIQGFRTGADDYMTKPFSIEELLLKIEVFLKRNKITKKEEAAVTRFSLGNMVFDFADLSLSSEKKKIQLTLKEAEILRYFCMNRGRILKREEILKAIWGNDDYFIGRSLDVFISKLRKYLESEPSIHIENIHGVGFKMSVDQEKPA